MLNRNENVIPAVARLEGPQAAAFFMLGETTGTAAGGKDEEGVFLRVPGTNPFFPMHHDGQGNRFLELLEQHPIDVYIMNTGRVGGPESESGSKKVRIPHSSAIVKAHRRGHDRVGGRSRLRLQGGRARARHRRRRTSTCCSRDGCTRRRAAATSTGSGWQRLKAERAEFLAQYPSLSAEIVNSVTLTAAGDGCHLQRGRWMLVARAARYAAWVTIKEPICGQLVCLATLSTDSVGDWVRWMDDPTTTRYLYAPGDQPVQPHSPSSLLDWGRRILSDPERVVFALRHRDSDRLIGDARLTPVGRRRAKFSIMIGAAEFRGRGIGTEATGMVCRFGFEQLGLREITLEVDPRNQAAVHAYLNVGFEHDGTTTMRLMPDRLAQVEHAPAAQ